MRDQVEQFLVDTGMWTPENRAKYNFLISQEVFPISRTWITQLEVFASVLQRFFVNKTGTYPRLCKVDVMIDQENNLKVAEVDGLNKRALGYAILQRQIAEMFGHQPENFFYGNEHALRDAVGSKKLVIIVPGREKYYQFGFTILVEALQNIGVDAVWGHEKTCLELLKNTDPATVVLLDLPRTRHSLDHVLSSTSWEVLIPNQEIFSSKTNLVQIDSPLVPRTVLVEVTDKPISCSLEKFVLKAPNKSGTKGIFFWDNIPKDLAQGTYVAQEMVNGKEHDFSHFDAQGTLAESGRWQVRLIVTLDLASSNVVDVDTTACKSRLVHGQFDSIQIAGVRTET